MKHKLVVGVVLCALLVGLSIAPVWAAPPATNRIIHSLISQVYPGTSSISRDIQPDITVPCIILEITGIGEFC